MQKDIFEKHKGQKVKLVLKPNSFALTGMVSVTEITEKRFYESTNPGNYINSGQPGVGKTRELVKHIKRNSKKDNPKHILILSSNHDHLDDIENSIPKQTTQHLMGFEKECIMIKYHEKLKARYRTYKNPKDTVCKTCGSRFNCTYKKQFSFLSDDESDTDDKSNKEPKIVTVLAPLEFAYLPPLQDWADEIYIDESVEKLSYHNIGVDKQSKINMSRTIQRLGNENNIEVKPLLEQLDIAYDIITSFRLEILKQGSLFSKEKPEILDNLDTSTYEDDDYVIQNGNYITHPSKVKPILDDTIREKLAQFSEEDYEKILFKLIRKDTRNRLIKVFINFPGQISAIREMLLIYQRKKELFPVNINEKILDKDSVDETNQADETRGAWYKKKDGTYLVSTIGKEYTSDNSIEIEKKSDSWVTFGVHMMHTVFELAEYRPVKLLDSSFNETCFNKLYYENQSNTDNLPVSMVKSEIKNNPKSHLYPVLTDRNKYQSNFSKSSLGIAGGNPPNKKCIGSIKDIRYFGRKAKNEGKTVALITFKEIEDKFYEPFGKKMVEHLGNLRGSNKQEKADMQINFGTLFHPTKTVLLDYISTFHEFPKDTTPIKDKHGRFDGYKDNELNEFFEWHVMEEQYQAIHRSRLLVHSKDIVLFGKISRKIIQNKECTIEEPQTFRKIQAKLLDTKTYYLKHPEEAQKLIVSEKLDKDIDSVCYVIENGVRVTALAYEFGITREEMEEIILNAYKPLINQVLKYCKWKKKEPNITNVLTALQKFSRIKSARVNGKVKKIKCEGISKSIGLFAIGFTKSQNKIDIKTITGVRGSGGNRKILILKK